MDKNLPAKTRNTSWGYINYQGEEGIPFIYDSSQPFHNGLGAISLNDKWGFVNKHGNIQIPIIYDEVKSFCSDLCSVKLNNYWGIINKSNEIVVPIIYSEVHFFEMGNFILRLGRVWQIFDNHCKILTEFDLNIHFQYVRNISDGFATVELNFKKGIIDYRGTIIVPTCYDEIECFNSHFLVGRLTYVGKKKR